MNNNLAPVIEKLYEFHHCGAYKIQQMLCVDFFVLMSTLSRGKFIRIRRTKIYNICYYY